MRKDLTDKIDVNPSMAKYSFANFKRIHEKAHPNDPLTTEERYKKIGGILPKKVKK